MKEFSPNFDMLRKYVHPWDQFLRISKGQQRIEDGSFIEIAKAAKKLGLVQLLNELLWFHLYFKNTGSIGDRKYKLLDGDGKGKKALAVEFARIEKLEKILLNPDVESLHIRFKPCYEAVVEERVERRKHELQIDSPGFVQMILDTIEKRRQFLTKIMGPREWKRIKDGLPEDNWRLAKMDQALSLFRLITDETPMRRGLKTKAYELIRFVLSISGGPDLTKSAIEKDIQRQLKKN